MILKLRGADFSADNIGNIPVEINLLPYTEAAIAASGNSSMTDLQKITLDNFFRTLGAGENDGIITKMRMLYLPIICTDVSKALVNYANPTFTADAVLSSSVWSLRNRGLVASATSPTITKVITNPLVASNFSAFWLRTELMETGVGDSQNVIILRGVSNSSLWCGIVEGSIAGDGAISWGNYGASPSWLLYTPKGGISEIKTAALVCRGVADIDRNVYGSWGTGTVTSLDDLSSETSETAYILNIGSNNTLKPYAVIMLGEAVTTQQAKDISSAIDALWDVFKSATPEV